MKALVYKGPEQLAVEQVSIPEIGANDALIKVRASGICGSDTHGYLGKTGRRALGVIMGHEFSGDVVKLGKNSGDWKIGDRVVVQPSIFCGECFYCKSGKTHLCINKRFLGVMDCNGAMAEYISVPIKLLYRMPDDMSYVDGALIEPLAVSKCAVDKIPFDLQGKKVLVVGAGTIGLLVVAVLKSRGASKIIVSDLSQNRLEFAKAMGADYTFNPMQVDVREQILKITDGFGADVSLEAVGADKPVETAISCLRLGGHSVWIGNSKKEIVLDMQSVVTREITIYGTYTYSHEEFGNTIYEMADMGIQTDKLVGELLPIEKASDMFAYLAAGNDDIVKTQIIFEEES
ncbi:MAG: galactitol-1-phosphate 5-dehydrogenase [Clostridia bacterium]|jgi:2-desacetyl-2-hydroxyethyl bacteriochlorophyllide A dehydrogenase|nr:galactitol-1-phosphate 5-dehydrogenase [Clostridia bacterium]